MKFYQSFVHLEFCVTILEEGVDLLGSSDTSVDIGLGCLSTHLLWCREVTTLELQELVVGIGHDVGNELQVFALLHQLDKLGLIDHFLTGCVDQHTTLLELAYESSVDALLGLGRCGDVERNDITGLEERILIGDSVNTSLLDDLCWAESIVGIDVHAEALGDASHVAAYITECEDTQLLAEQL